MVNNYWNIVISMVYESYETYVASLFITLTVPIMANDVMVFSEWREWDLSAVFHLIKK